GKRASSLEVRRARPSDGRRPRRRIHRAVRARLRDGVDHESDGSRPQLRVVGADQLPRAPLLTGLLGPFRHARGGGEGGGGDPGGAARLGAGGGEDPALMPWIVDGSNVLGAARAATDAKRELVRHLGRFARAKKTRVVCIFDGDAPEHFGTHLGGVSVVFSGPRSADDLIVA